ncbi:ATP phosphoribosyltransferase regulatory subunit, partial [Candidatus Saccharibacteria bacterium]|nr:ATP phosphoribosyltransferase regulatory subunit [Candidatus Saccharibacteria bacterium]
MALSTQPVKGARDFYPADMWLEKYIFRVWREVCERFGYEEYDAPILESTDLYLAKGNQEIIDEQTYSFTDRGGRNLTLRTEMTPTVSRMVAARRQELAYPARLYSIPQCWRYERMQRGRGREFYQLNVDVFGLDNLAAEQEMITMADAILKQFGAKPKSYEIKISSRMMVDALMRDVLGLDQTQAQSLIRLIDRMKKMETAKFAALVDAVFTSSQRETGAV